jgi:hypothetical protein
VRTERIQQETVVTARDGEAEVVVHALVEAVEDGRPKRGGQVDLRLVDEID